MDNLDLKNHDRFVIEEGGLLNDRHMHAAHQLLRKQFPLLNGLQSTLLIQSNGFSPVASNGRNLYTTANVA